MKTIFNKKELISRRGCYRKERIEELLSGREEVTINDILTEENVNIYDRVWFVFNSCDLTTDEKVKLSNKMAWVVLPVFEEQFPDDKRVRNCLAAIDKFNNKLIKKRELITAAGLASAAAWASVSYYKLDAWHAAEAASWSAAATARKDKNQANKAASWAVCALKSCLKKGEIINLLIKYFNNENNIK